MIASIRFGNQSKQINFAKPLDISIPLSASHDNPTAWYVDPPIIEPVRTEHFTGSVAEGGSVNFRNIQFNPHGHGTHTECLGHITPEVYSINDNLKRFIFWVELISIKPLKLENGDEVITKAQIEQLRGHLNTPALAIRTLPNSELKKKAQYSDTNPPYIESEAIKAIIDSGVDHLLIDLPSVDREQDEGVLAAHHQFWEYPENPQFQRTITEMIFVPETIKDGLYLLNLQIAPFENDASPSKPILYPVV